MEQRSDYQIATFKNVFQVTSDVNGVIFEPFFNDTFGVNSSRQILVKGFFATFEYRSLSNTFIPAQLSKQKNGLNYSFFCQIDFVAFRFGVLPNPFMDQQVLKLSNNVLLLNDGVFLPEQFYVDNNGRMEVGGVIVVNSLPPNADYLIQVEFAVYYCEL